MKIIKFAVPYHAFLPPLAILEESLEAVPYAAPMETELRSIGFTPRNSDSSRLISEFEGGFAFFVRVDEKIIPGAAIASGLREAVQKVYKETGRYPGRKEKLELRDQVALDYRRKALIKTTVIGCFYNPATRCLVLSTPSQRLADLVMNLLRDAVGGLRVEPIHQPDLSDQMITRLKLWLAEEDNAPFDGFELSTELMLVGSRKKLTIKTTNIEHSRQAIREAVESDYTFKLARLEHEDGISFRFGDDFCLKSLEYENPNDLKADDNGTLWQHEAALQMMLLTRALTLLIAMFNVKFELQP